MRLQFDWNVILNSTGMLFEALEITVFLAVLAVVLSLFGGLLLALARISSVHGVSRSAEIYIELFRNTPLLIQLYLIYFGLPIIGIVIPTMTTAVIALTLQHSAFMGEILRGGFLSVPRTQLEAGRAMGMTPSKMFRIIVFPQALSTAIPSLTGACVILVQDTSLVASIAVVDLTMAAKLISTRTASSYEPFLMIAALYLILSWIVSGLGRLVERRTFIHR